MTQKHDKHHDHCEHEMKHCGKCDLVYCVKCSKEWGAECSLTHFPYYWYVPGTASDPAYQYPWTTTTAKMDLTNTDLTVAGHSTVCSHS